MASSTAGSPDEYLYELPEVKQTVIKMLRHEILRNLPEGFEEMMSYGMIGYAVPLRLYPSGYHANPALPLPFINLAAQKNHFAVYHMGLYGNARLMKWFIAAYAKQTGLPPDIGKSCIRFKKAADIPYTLIGELCGKISVEEWIRFYEKNITL